mmetsp:Transcript_92838/g.259462  ORF Transcript_92838/g.259462 Transcript_92838/m.259462 type:complete len:251 (+) Transcript_92838:273-1025(+)
MAQRKCVDGHVFLRTPALRPRAVARARNPGSVSRATPWAPREAQVLQRQGPRRWRRAGTPPCGARSRGDNSGNACHLGNRLSASRTGKAPRTARDAPPTRRRATTTHRLGLLQRWRRRTPHKVPVVSAAPPPRPLPSRPQPRQELVRLRGKRRSARPTAGAVGAMAHRVPAAPSRAAIPPAQLGWQCRQRRLRRRARWRCAEHSGHPRAPAETAFWSAVLRPSRTRACARRRLSPSQAAGATCRRARRPS